MHASAGKSNSRAFKSNYTHSYRVIRERSGNVCVVRNKINPVMLIIAYCSKYTSLERRSRRLNENCKGLTRKEKRENSNTQTSFLLLKHVRVICFISFGDINLRLCKAFENVTSFRNSSS